MQKQLNWPALPVIEHGHLKSPITDASSEARQSERLRSSSSGLQALYACACRVQAGAESGLSASRGSLASPEDPQVIKTVLYLL